LLENNKGEISNIFDYFQSIFDSFNSIKEEKQILPFSFDSKIGFITTKRVGELIGIIINIGFNILTDSVSIVKYSLMGYINTVNIFHDSFDPPSGESIISIIG
jgi:hypothetical protein